MSPQIIHRLKEGLLILMGLIAVYLLLSFASFNPNDPSWSHQGNGQVVNLGGPVGAWFADIGLSLFGYMAYLFPPMLIFLGWRIYQSEQKTTGYLADVVVRIIGFICILGASTALTHMHTENANLVLPSSSGGILGEIIAVRLVAIAGFLGGTLLLLGVFFAGVTVVTGLSWLNVMDKIGKITLDFFQLVKSKVMSMRDWLEGRKAKVQREHKVITEIKKVAKRKAPKIEPSIVDVKAGKRAEAERQKTLFTGDGSELPPLSLLDLPQVSKKGFSKEVLEALSRQVELKLADFGIEVAVVAVHPGPVITRFELQPAAGVKSSQISSLAKDLARGLSVISVRVVEVIPGKAFIGLELPNEHREIVYLSEILRSAAYDKSSSPLSLALGKDIAGNPVVVDIAKMPHLLVAGTTGSGKSVAVNAMILSLLYKAKADQVRLILIDPKMLELSVYEGIAHLLAPVVTDMKEAANALRWCVAEMERRYKLMAAVGVRNLAGFNKKIKEAEKQGAPIKDPLFNLAGAVEGLEAQNLEELPFIVVVIDEFADMMMMVGKKVEELIARLAQKARAAGIHLILATQRPSVDVITGLIKANIPTRIAFQVSSKIDSRTILDQMGAEQLLGHGDMLYQVPGMVVPDRVHGAFVDDHEVHKVVECLKQCGEPNYVDDVLSDVQTLDGGQTVGPTGLPESANSDLDELFDQAVFFVTENRRVSISSIQRKFKIGYNRAARIVEDMEEQGIVTPPESNGNRKVLAPPPVSID